MSKATATIAGPLHAFRDLTAVKCDANHGSLSRSPAQFYFMPLASNGVTLDCLYLCPAHAGSLFGYDAVDAARAERDLT